MRHMRFFSLLLFMTLGSLWAFAHVELDNPQGDENLKTGDLLYISWHVVI